VRSWLLFEFPINPWETPAWVQCGSQKELTQFGFPPHSGTDDPPLRIAYELARQPCRGDLSEVDGESGFSAARGFEIPPAIGICRVRCYHRRFSLVACANATGFLYYVYSQQIEAATAVHNATVDQHHRLRSGEVELVFLIATKRD